jgi:hypothetical protein
LLLGLLPFGDVEHDSLEDGLARLGCVHDPVVVHPHDVSILGHEAVLALHGLTRAPALLLHLQDPGSILRVDL